MQRFLKWAALASLVLPTVASQAAPISYSESVDGDLPPFDPVPTFTFDIGVNTVSGSISLILPDVDFDAFAFVVPAGLQVTSGSATLVDVAGDVSSAKWQLHAGSDQLYNGTPVKLLDISSPGSDTIPALGSNTYNLSPHEMGQRADNSTANYTFTFNVIPEPASLSLLALGSVALLRRRR